MGQKSRKKLDILMTVLMIVVMSYQATGNLFHEAAGVILLVLFIVHNILNRNWYKNIRGGNSDTLCEQFMKGCVEDGHSVEKIKLCEYKK